jgi:hypothetical protein
MSTGTNLKLELLKMPKLSQISVAMKCSKERLVPAAAQPLRGSSSSKGPTAHEG